MRPMRHAGWANLVWIFILRRNGGWLDSQTDADEADPAQGEDSAKPAIHGRQISDKDSNDASETYKSSPLWINSIS